MTDVTKNDDRKLDWPDSAKIQWEENGQAYEMVPLLDTSANRVVFVDCLACEEGMENRPYPLCDICFAAVKELRETMFLDRIKELM